MNPVNKYSLNMWLWILSAIMLIGFWGLYIRINQGLAITNLNNIVGWGLWVSFYIFFIGLSAGSFLIVTSNYAFGNDSLKEITKVGLYTALITMLGGFLFLLIDIGHMGRFWTVFFHRNWTSILSWGMQLYLFYLLFVCTLLVLAIKNRATLQNQKVVKILTYIGIPLAIAIHGGNGAVFAVIKARAFWNSPLFPVVFLVSALLSGVAILLLISILSPQLRKNLQLLNKLAKTMGFLLIASIILILFQHFIGFYEDIPDKTINLNLLMTGDFSTLFWVGQIIIGAALPLMIIAISKLRNSVAWLAVSSLMVLMGNFVGRINLVIPTLTIPVMEGIVEAYSAERVSAFYIPSFFEWFASLVIVAFVAVLLNIGFKFLPLLDKE
jgi:molybdopterin-containing oxidoreductase family membrane subunit